MVLMGVLRWALFCGLSRNGSRKNMDRSLFEQDLPFLIPSQTVNQDDHFPYIYLACTQPVPDPVHMRQIQKNARFALLLKFFGRCIVR